MSNHSREELVFNQELLDRNKIGYLPQMSTGDNNFPVTVKDVILVGTDDAQGTDVQVCRSRQEKASQVIDELGLAELSDSSLSELSGGQLQRVFLGRAVIGDPKLLLLDEPGNFVDSNFENDFYEKLRI